MSVGYKDLSVANMDTEDSNISYKRLQMDPRKLRFSVHNLKENPIRLAVVCLGVLCLLLLAALIGESVIYRIAQQEKISKLQSMNAENEKIQKSMSSLQNNRGNLEEILKELEKTLERTRQRKNQIQESYNTLAEETGKLRQSETMLKTSNAALTKELQQVNATVVKLQSNTEQLSTAKNLLQEKLEQAVKLTTTLDSNYKILSAERNILQNSFSNVTRVKDQLQLRYIMLMTDVEELEKRLNVTFTEKDQAEATHMNTTSELQQLHRKHSILVGLRRNLMHSFSFLWMKQNEIENNKNSYRRDSNLLQMKIRKLIEERDRLKVKAAELNATLAANNCPSGWKPYMQSCYFTSGTKRNWRNSRDYCKNNSADLAVVTSQEEMTFISGLYSRDKEVWIGLSDDGIEGRWTWVDGTLLNPNATFWSGQPSSRISHNQNCVEFWHRAPEDKGWKVENCDIEQYWLCETVSSGESKTLTVG